MAWMEKAIDLAARLAPRLGRRGALLAGLALPAPALAQNRPAARPAPRREPPPPPGPPAATLLGPLDTPAKQALVIDFDTDTVLLEKNADERMAPSSMSKLMTLYLVFQRLKEGKLQLAQELPVTARARNMGGSRMFVEIGSTISVENLIHGVIVHSGNDACVVLAEGIAGSEQQFADLATQTGRRIGLTASTFRNATGWPDPEHRMTSRDLARLAKRLVVDFPDYYHFFNQRSFTWNNITQQNRNPLLERTAGTDGLKTGHTEEGGYGLVASTKRGDRRIIVVVNGLATMRARAEEPDRLMEWGFREFENVVLFKTAEVVEEAPVWLGARPTVPLIFGGREGRDLVVTLPRSWRRNLTAKVRYEAPIPAPVLKGQELGRLEIAGQGVATMSLPLLAGADVERLGMMGRIPKVLGRWMGS
jgi:D-alanyl-D-alanine carboxypeptidase (penicillin-binding protein 5/6)